ncbi:MAG: polyphosphate kinase 1 [Actinobacteria bacterium]|nr:polyphosphate kinase 1 [Actinomycetota bacterium]
MNKYINRELSWLSFNERVLQEAEDATVPLLERLQFLGIFSSNLDEFFSVRVGTLNRLIASGQKPATFLGGTPKAVLEQVIERSRSLRKRFEKDLTLVLDELVKENVIMVDERGLSQEQEEYLQDYFSAKVRPRLIPIMLDNVHVFPYLYNLVIYLAIVIKIKDKASGRQYALIEVPADVLPRFNRLPGSADKAYIIMLDDIIRYGLKDIFSMFEFEDISAYTIKMTRDSELDIETDITTSLFEQISRSIKNRKYGGPVRFVYDREIPDDFLQYIAAKKEISPQIMISGGRYHNARDMATFPDLGKRFNKLKYKHPEPLEHAVLRNYTSTLQAIADQDVLLHFPYQSFHYIIDLLREAAIDKDVVSIKMTLYRVADESQVVNALINAVRNGKEVTVVVELQARFDEEANIQWTERLVEEGANVIPEIPGVKVHCKLLHITRRDKRGFRHYAGISTGNFNESTARIYADHVLLTSDPRITSEVEHMFEFLENSFKSFNYRHLLVSPFNMTKKLYKHIKGEVKNAQEGKDAYIYAKLNSFSHKKTINRLYRANNAGVSIKMVNRGICCLIPGVEGLSENIEVISIVDKYLEHSRIIVFCNDNDPLVFISSADWMTRNFERRIEVGVPIYDQGIKQELIDYVGIQLSDNVKARIINDKQDNSERNVSGKKKIRAQDAIYGYLEDKLRSDNGREQ